MITADQLIEIGRYNKAHGIIPQTIRKDVREIIEISKKDELSALVSPMDGIFVPFFVNGIRPKNNDTLLLKIDGISNETQAKRLVNCPIYALAEEMPEQDEVYCDFFIGFTITDTDGNTIGTITDVDDSTENALFVVENEGKTVYIPISEDFITEIDEQGKPIEMDLPEGILDL